MIGVKGWYSANCLMPWPIFAAGTTALLRNGSKISGTTPRPADSGVFAAIPRATVSQAGANGGRRGAPGRGEPVQGGGGRPEAEREGHPDDDRDGDRGAQH